MNITTALKLDSKYIINTYEIEWLYLNILIILEARVANTVLLYFKYYVIHIC